MDLPVNVMGISVLIITVYKCMTPYNFKETFIITTFPLTIPEIGGGNTRSIILRRRDIGVLKINQCPFVLK